MEPNLLNFLIDKTRVSIILQSTFKTSAETLGDEQLCIKTNYFKFPLYVHNTASFLFTLKLRRDSRNFSRQNEKSH